MWQGSFEKINGKTLFLQNVAKGVSKKLTGKQYLEHVKNILEKIHREKIIFLEHGKSIFEKAGKNYLFRMQKKHFCENFWEKKLIIYNMAKQFRKNSQKRTSIPGNTSTNFWLTTHTLYLHVHVQYKQLQTTYMHMYMCRSHFHTLQCTLSFGFT